MGLCRLYKLVQTFLLLLFMFNRVFASSTSVHKPITWHIKNKYIAQITPLYVKYKLRTAAMLSLFRSSIFTYYTNKRPLCTSSKVCRKMSGGGIKRGRSANGAPFCREGEYERGRRGSPPFRKRPLWLLSRRNEKVTKKLFK